MAIYQSMQRVRFSSPDGYEVAIWGGAQSVEDVTRVLAPHLVGPSERSLLVQRDQPVDEL
jgi:hypothetical protein